MDGNDTKALEAMEGRAEIEDWSEETRQKKKKAIIRNHVHIFFHFFCHILYIPKHDDQSS